MSIRKTFLMCAAGSLALFASAATAGAASDVTITDAKIEAGRLVIAGKSATAGMTLRLDGKAGTGFTVTSGPDRTFKFSLVYLPKDCIADVQRIMPTAKLGASNELVVANCAPAGISARGVWSAKLAYEPNDLVSHRGASWLAKRDSLSERPDDGSAWQLFAAKGDAGEAGAAAKAGEAGAAGTDGANGDSTAVAGAEKAVPDSPAVPSGPAGGDLAGTYPDPTIKTGAVSTPKLEDGAVTLLKLRDLAVATAKLRDDAVTSIKILDGAVTSSDIANDAVTTAAIAAGAVTSGDIANGAVITAKLPDAAVTTGKIAGGAVIAGKIANGAVVEIKIASAAVTTPKIADLAVTTPKIADLAILEGKIADTAVTSAKILDGGVTGTDVLDETLTDVDLAANSVGSSEIATDAVSATEIANDSIDSGEIVDFGLSNQDIGVLFAQVNVDGTLANSSGGVTSAKISTGTYEVDFGRDVSSCAPVMTQGEAAVGSAGGAITGVTDRAGNVEAFFATTRTDANALADRAFHLVVVC